MNAADLLDIPMELPADQRGALAEIFERPGWSVEIEKDWHGKPLLRLRAAPGGRGKKRPSFVLCSNEGVPVLFICLAKILDVMGVEG